MTQRLRSRQEPAGLHIGKTWHFIKTLAFARLDTPDPDEGAKAFRVDYKGISIRGIYQYNAILDRTLYRWDILFGTKAQNPSFACRITE
jgi:hypothetical protein